MKREILLIYQDCPMCGARENWGKAQLETKKTYGLKYREVPFTSAELQGDILMRAIQAGMKSYPFFTDGKKFSKTLEDFVEKTTDESKAGAEVVASGSETNAEVMAEKPAGWKMRRKKRTEAEG